MANVCWFIVLCIIGYFVAGAIIAIGAMAFIIFIYLLPYLVVGAIAYFIVKAIKENKK